MKHALRCAALFVGFAVLVAGATTATQGQDKKDKKAKVTAAVTAGEKVGKDWLIREAKTGLKILSDKDYVIAALPKEAVGGTFLMRSSPELGKWLHAGAVSAKADGTVYAIVLVNQFGKEKFTEVAQEQFAKDGWKAMDDKVGTTFPSGEKWEWKAFKKEMKEGDQILQLDTLSWDKHGTAVLYIFK